MTWLQQFINNLYHSVPLELKVREISDLEIEIECDELWSYVNSKENPVYIWLGISTILVQRKVVKQHGQIMAMSGKMMY